MAPVLQERPLVPALKSKLTRALRQWSVPVLAGLGVAGPVAAVDINNMRACHQLARGENTTALWSLLLRSARDSHEAVEQCLQRYGVSVNPQSAEKSMAARLKERNSKLR